MGDGASVADSVALREGVRVAGSEGVPVGRPEDDGLTVSEAGPDEGDTV